SGRQGLQNVAGETQVIVPAGKAANEPPRCQGRRRQIPPQRAQRARRKTVELSSCSLCSLWFNLFSWRLPWRSWRLGGSFPLLPPPRYTPVTSPAVAQGGADSSPLGTASHRPTGCRRNPFSREESPCLSDRICSVPWPSCC